ncbi:MAG: hypothetical protein GX808_00255 [Syntrophomonadaceae bacterium]|jgi:hypothetical protein|nr:hypothetical protein [Syntrophomonadaceae bacterium]
MRKVIIGSVITLSGLIITMSIIMAAAFYAPHITSWSGSKLWFAIFGAERYGSEVIQSLFLGTPFIIGIILLSMGLVILVREYFRED